MILNELFGLYQAHAAGSQHQEHSCKQEHGALAAAHEGDDGTAGGGGDYLRQADRAVEQAQVAAHVGIAFQRVGEEGERQGENRVCERIPVERSLRPMRIR